MRYFFMPTLEVMTMGMCSNPHMVSPALLTDVTFQHKFPEEYNIPILHQKKASG